MLESDLKGLELLFRGKVRDVYAIDDERLLLVQTDRVSAFDVVFNEPIPGKGAALTRIALHWFRETADMVANHLLDEGPEMHVSGADLDAVRGRSMVVRRMRPYPLEAVVRGYLAGSGHKEYRRDGSVCGIGLPPGLELGDALPEPIFTPATKAARGDHDENVDFGRAAEIVGDETARRIRRKSLELYSRAHGTMLRKGIVLADTKFEFAAGDDGGLVLVDEALTPDSSRYWPADGRRRGVAPENLDKQILRDWAERTGWNKAPPPPPLDDGIVSLVAERYARIENIILG